MATSENAKIQYEAGQTLVPIEEFSDSGDQTSFESVSAIMSDRGGYAPVITPNGLITGGLVSLAVSGTNDLIDVAAIVCYLAGVETSVGAATDETVLRGATTDTHRINSVTVDTNGAIAIVSGVDHTEFSETRGADGGPPYIPITSIEIAQVRLTSVSAAAVTADEIFQVVNQHQERFDFPTFETKLLRVENQVIGLSGVDFASALPTIHTADVPKKVYGLYYTPIFAELAKTSDFVPAETTHTANSTQIYGGAIAAKSSTLGQASFTAYLDTGISDAIVKIKNAKLWFKYFQNRLNSTPYILTNGYLGLARTFPADNQNQASATITSEIESEEVTL